MSKSVRIVTAHDGARYFTAMADIAKTLAEKAGHELEIIRDTGIKHKKSTLLLDALTEEWVVWMDADSMILGNIDHLFEIDCDLIVNVKEPVNRSTKYGTYLYSGFVCVRNTPAGIDLLKRWQGGDTDQPSDQFNLNKVLEDYLDDAVYDQHGTTQTYGDLRVHLLDPNIYCHTQSIRDGVYPPDEVNVLHFKGRTHRLWRDYKRKFLC